MAKNAGHTSRRALDDALTYRQPMRVTQVMVRSFSCGETGWAVCPRCGVTMDREYMRFCDRCGQRLEWRGYKHAEVVYPKIRNNR